MVLRALFLRSLKHRPVRYVVTVIGVAVGIASVISTILSSNAAVASLRQGVEEVAGRARLEIIQPGGVDDSLLGDLRPFARDAVIAPVIEEIALLPELNDAIRILGIDPLVDRQLRDLELLTSDENAFQTFSDLLTGQGALLPEAMAERLGVSVGDTITISARSRLESLEVLGILRPRRFSAAWNRLLIVDIACAQKIFGRSGQLDRIELLPRNGVDTQSLASEMRRHLPANVNLQPPSTRSQQTQKMVGALSFNLTALSGISLLVGAVLVATTLATSVVQRRDRIALLRSLGASRSQIALALIVEALSIGIIGGVLGILLGYFGARLCLSSVRATMAVVIHGAPESEINFSPLLAACGIGMGIIVSLAAAILPLLEAYRTPPLQNLRNERPEFLRPVSRRHALMLAVLFIIAAAALLQLPPMNDLPVAALLGALCLLAALMVVESPLLDSLARLGMQSSPKAGPEGISKPDKGSRMLRITLAILSAGRRRVSWAAGAIGVTVALAVAIATMIASFRVTVGDWTEQSLKADIVIRSMSSRTGLTVGRLDPDLAAVAIDLFGEHVVDPFYTTRAFMNERPVTLAAGKLDVVRHHGGVPFRDGRDSRDVFTETLRQRGAIINEPFARRFGIDKGDTIRLDVRDGILERKVTGVFYDYSRNEGMVIIDLDDYLQFYPADGPETIALFFHDDVDVSQARQKLSNAIAGRWKVEILLNKELRREVMSVFERTFAITRALQIVAAIVAVIAVLTVLFALAGERRQDMALLRALGGSRPQIAGLVACEAGLLGFIGATGGFITGLMIGWLLVKVVNIQSFGWTLRFLPPWSTLSMILIWVVGACLVAGLAPAVYCACHTPWEVLREDE